MSDWKKGPEGSHEDWINAPEAGATISWSRITCNPSRSLFGSKVRHREIVQVSIQAAKESRHLNQEWVHGELAPIAEVWMSPVQFAEFVTSPNMGTGVTATLTAARTGPWKQFQPPEFMTETQRMRRDFAKDMEELQSHLERMEEICGEMETAPAIGKKRRKEMAETVKRCHRVLTDHLPFMLDQFTASMDRVVVEAKESVNAYVERRLREEGLKALEAEVQEVVPSIEHDPDPIPPE